MGRAPCCEKVGLKKGRWTKEEDQLLVDHIKSHGDGSWRSLPKQAGLLRCGKSCRLRWINYLREDLKRGNISKEEEDTIIQLRATLGNRWSVIADHLPGRTDNEIKNYWSSHLSKNVQDSQKKNLCSPDAVRADKDVIGAGGCKQKGDRLRKLGQNKKGGDKILNVVINETLTKEVEIMIVDSQPQHGNEELGSKDEDFNPGGTSSSSLGVRSSEENENATWLSSSSEEKESGALAIEEERRREEEKGGELEMTKEEVGHSLDEIEWLLDWEPEDIAMRLWEWEEEGEIWPSVGWEWEGE